MNKIKFNFKDYLFSVCFSFFAVAALSVPILAFAESDVSEFQVPSNWIAGSSEKTELRILNAESQSMSSDSNSTSKFELGLTKLLMVPRKFLEKNDVGSASNFSIFSPTESEKPKWRLTHFIFDLGVSLGGTMGFSLKGTTAAQVTWLRKASTVQAPKILSNEGTEADAMDSSAIAETLNGLSGDPKRMEGMIRMIMSTGKVSDENSLRANLKQTVDTIDAMTASLEKTESVQWSLSKIRFDLSVSGSGVVGPYFTSVGGGVRVRFDWAPVPKKPTPGVPRIISPIAESLVATLQGVARDLDVWNAGDANPALTLKAARVGLGLNVKFGVGVVKMGVTAFGYATFNRKVVPAFSLLSENQLIKNAKPVELLVSDVATQSARWGQLVSGHSFSLRSDSENKDSVLKLNPLELSKGLKKASKIGEFILKTSEKVLNKSTWSVATVKTGFEFSVGGSIDLVGITGTVGLELVFVPTL